MPAFDKVYCTHCERNVSRKTELRHRRLVSSAPYTTGPRQGTTSQEPYLIPENGTSSTETDTDTEALISDGANDFEMLRYSNHDSGLLDDSVDNRQHAIEDDTRIDEGQAAATGSFESTLEAAENPDSIDYNHLLIRDRMFLHGALWTSSGEFSEDDDDASDIEDVDDDEEDLVNLFMNVDWGKNQSGLPAQAMLGEQFDCWVASLEKRLSNYDLSICLAFAFKIRSHITDKGFNMTPYAFPQDPPRPKLREILRRVAELSDIKPEIYDCCINSCQLYVGIYEKDHQCSFCKEPCLGANGRPRKRFTYIPIIPRLVALASNRTMAEKMTYRRDFQYTRGKTEDVFSGQLYRKLCKLKVTFDSQQFDR
ncbi:hypothetical protein PM082_021912 [Marasmius tenuissimus]|nr:hypothetical protein PM082_021912 [Marasmius tenuissimus]